MLAIFAACRCCCRVRPWMLYIHRVCYVCMYVCMAMCAGCTDRCDDWAGNTDATTGIALRITHRSVVYSRFRCALRSVCRPAQNGTVGMHAAQNEFSPLLVLDLIKWAFRFPLCATEGNFYSRFATLFTFLWSTMQWLLLFFFFVGSSCACADCLIGHLAVVVIAWRRPAQLV